MAAFKHLIASFGSINRERRKKLVTMLVWFLANRTLSNKLLEIKSGSAKYLHLIYLKVFF